MFEAIRTYLPVEWRRPFEFLAAPIWWIPEWQGAVLAAVLSGATTAVLVGKAVLLLPPALLVIVGLWSTMLGLYTIPFRARRSEFLTTVALSWWDAGRSVWLYWAGLVRVVVMALGWIWGLLKLAGRILLRTLRAIFVSPMRFMDWSARRYFQPGVPWLAFLLTVGWSALEATIFTFTLAPTLREVLAAITGYMPESAFMLPVVWLFLFFLIAGSFACIQVLAEAVESREIPRIVEMLFVEFFVMFFEVVFLYRELVDAITPWIAQQTAGEVQMGLWSTLAVASFGWIGIRGMTWFLFARFGTPAMLAVLSRETIEQGEGGEAVAEPADVATAWKEPLELFKEERAWFRGQAEEAFELVTLPVLQLLAAAVNFPVIVLRGEPVFRLPLESLDDVLEVTPLASDGRRPTGGTQRPAAGTQGGASAPDAPVPAGEGG